MESGIVFYDIGSIEFSKSPIRLLGENVRRILMTPLGSRVNNLEFGSRLHSYLFMPEMLIDDIENEIRFSINRWEPRAEITKLNIKKGSEEHIVVEIGIKDKTTGNTADVSFDAT